MAGKTTAFQAVQDPEFPKEWSASKVWRGFFLFHPLPVKQNLDVKLWYFLSDKKLGEISFLYSKSNQSMTKRNKPNPNFSSLAVCAPYFFPPHRLSQKCSPLCWWISLGQQLIPKVHPKVHPKVDWNSLHRTWGRFWQLLTEATPLVPHTKCRQRTISSFLCPREDMSCVPETKSHHRKMSAGFFFSERA